MRLAFSSACCALALACGAPPPASSPTSTEPAPSSAPATGPAAACLAAAGATRAKRPGEPDGIGVRHVLVLHAGSKRATEGVIRDRAAACLRAAEARDEVLAGADFDAVVAKYSEEPGAATRGGSIGTIRRADVDPAFADAAFELDRGQMSDVVETPFGFHVILRVE